MNIVTKDGLNHFWDKLKDKLAQKVDKYINHKQYTNDYMYNNNANGNCTGYDREFATVVANDWSKPWFVKFIIKTDLFYNNTTHYPSFHEVLVGCDNVSGNTWVKNFNVIKNTSYRATHYITAYRPQSAAKANNAPFRLNFRAGDQSSKTAHPRSYDVYLVETVNCTCTLNDTLDNQAFQKWYYDDHAKNAYYWSATSGGTFYSVNYDLASNGLQETGDSNNYEIVSHYYAYYVAGTGGINRYTIIMQDKDGKYQSIVNEDNAYTVLTKTANTAQFKLNEPMFFYNSSAKLNSGSRCGAGTLRSICGPIDARYSLNILADATNKLTAYAKLYLVGTIDSEGYFKLDTTKWWSETEPTEDDGKVYIYIGIVYSDTNPYRVSPEMEFANNAYWFKNGQFRHYGDYGKTVQANVPADAKFTDTIVDISNKADKSTTLSGYGITNAYTKSEVDNKIASASGVTWDIIYPVGYVFISTVNTSPQTLFGGTWVSVGNNLRLSSTDYFWGGIEIYAWKRTA